MYSKSSCWFHALCLISILINFVYGQVSPGGTVTVSTSVAQPVVSTSVIVISDPCKSGSDNCTTQYADCVSTGGGAFRCDCIVGMSGNGFGANGCQDINECTANTSICSSFGSCVNSIGSYECSCNSGYTRNTSILCTDINECTDSTKNTCDNSISTCVNNAGGYTCNCITGYKVNTAGQCVDLDECTTGTFPCGSASCLNRVGSYECYCDPATGFTLQNNSGSFSCQDTNECLDSTLNFCIIKQYSQCLNDVNGTYTCPCGTGFNEKNGQCININECTTGAKTCGTNGVCTDTIGGATCSCETGYSGNGSVCTDINECTTASVDHQHKCVTPATCNNLLGSYECKCPSTYVKNGLYNCDDINECLTNPKPCKGIAVCQNTIGNYSCSCPNGYNLNSTNGCSDIDECAGTTHGCSPNGICTNSIGSYACSCNIGYRGDGITCNDMNECESSNDCSNAATCNNTVGSYRCDCNTGYSGNGTYCQDIDECTLSSPCGTSATGTYTCINTPGSHLCLCVTGYQKNSTNACQDIDECAALNTCYANSLCTNSAGSYTCKCNTGFLESNDDGGTKSCVVDRFAKYTSCNYMQNVDEINGEAVLQIAEGIPFGGVLENDFYVCVNGIIAVGKDYCHNGPTGNLGAVMQNGTLFGPLFADIDTSIPANNANTTDNRVYHCMYTAVNPTRPPSETTEMESMVKANVRKYTNLTDYVPRNTITATWYRVSPFKAIGGSNYFHSTMKATVQAVITSDGKNTIVYYVYHQVDWKESSQMFQVQIGYRYIGGTESITPNVPSPYSRLRADKATFINPNGVTETGFYAIIASTSVNTESVSRCTSWAIKQPTTAQIESVYKITGSMSNATSTAIKKNRRISDCACTLKQILSDKTYSIEDASLENDLNFVKCHTTLTSGEFAFDSTKCINLKNYPDTCLRKRNFFTPDSSFNFGFSVATRCCYNTHTGAFITTTIPGTQNHFIDSNATGNYSYSDDIARDGAAYKACCLDTPLCSQFTERIRVPDCSGYAPPQMSTTFGDPHIVTLDGLSYTFNGLGDYWMLTSINKEQTYKLQIQARTCQALTSIGKKTPATVFCGFAFTEEAQPTFEIYHNDTTELNDYVVNGVQKTLSSGSEGSTAVIHTKSTNTTQFIFPSGTVVAIETFTHMLQARITSSPNIEGLTQGLLGNINSNINDDFISRTGTVIPATSAEETIYRDFGQTWKVLSNESIFSRINPISNTTFVPKFFTNVSEFLNYNETLINSTRAICGSETIQSNKACYFDYAVTGNEDLAASSKAFIEQSILIIETIGRAVPKLTGPTQINVTRFVPMNFTITASSNATNLTYYIVTNFTQSFKLLDRKTGLVSFTPKYNNETITVGVIDEFSQSATFQPVILVCDCINDGTCVYSHPQLKGNLGSVFTLITQCNCRPGYSGYRCETYTNICIDYPCFDNVNCTIANDTAVCDACPNGYGGTGRKCYDIDDCAAGNNNLCNQTCINNVGGYDCSCRSGFVAENKYNCSDIDECALNATICNSTLANSLCINTYGRYRCICNTGYRMNSAGLCADINECTEGTHQCKQGCVNTQGSYTCKCYNGYQLKADSISCNDINECANRTLNECDAVKASCVNTDGSFICKCNFGYKDNGGKCEDQDECSADIRLSMGLTTTCATTCTNNVGSYVCSCDTGFQLSNDNHTCIERLNPCIIKGSYPCSQYASCSFNSSTGAVSCSCKTGFTGNGTTCTDKNECTNGEQPCVSPAICNNMIGSYNCSCPSGYSLNTNKRNCSDIQECALGKFTCPANSKCVNTQGSYQCNCSNGYVKNGSLCIDINECLTNCDAPSQTCTNNKGSYTCVCATGYMANAPGSTQCNDINECVSNNDCASKADCTNAVGSYACKCKAGYSGNGTTCTDVNECASSLNNSCQQRCVNNNGGYTCTCLPGYSLNVDRRKCTDINECLVGDNGKFVCLPSTKYQCTNKPAGGYTCREKCPGNCTQRCNDTATSYKCSCYPGYKLDGLSICKSINGCLSNDCHKSAKCVDLSIGFKCQCPTGTTGNGTSQCIDINECANSNGGCNSNATCTNSYTTYSCKCKPGFDGNGSSCVDRNECTKNGSGCHLNAKCHNIHGSFNCTCNPGYSGNGSVCADTNECTTNNGNCHKDANCENTIGSYNCSCKTGFVGDGRDCSSSIILTTSAPLITESPTDIKAVLVASMVMSGIVVDGAPLVLSADLQDISSPASKRLITKLLPSLKRVIKIAVPTAADVTINSFSVLDSSGNVKFSKADTLKMSYTMLFLKPAPEASAVTSSIKSTLNSQPMTSAAFSATVKPTSLTISAVNQCTTTVAAAKHKCHAKANCLGGTSGYTCKCYQNYAGDGFTCKYSGTDNNFVIAIGATAGGLLLLLILLILFILIRKHRRGYLEEVASNDSDSSAGNVSWTPDPYGGMRARKMYTPRSVQPSQYRADAER